MLVDSAWVSPFLYDAQFSSATEVALVFFDELYKLAGAVTRAA